MRRLQNQTIEGDAKIYAALLEFAATHKDWKDVREVLDGLASESGRRITLTMKTGELVGDTGAGFGRPATGPISSNFKATGIFTSDVRNYNVPNGVEMANKLLDEAGYPRGADGTRFEIVHDITPYGEEWRRFGEYVQQQLAKLGIKPSLRYEDVPTAVRR